MLGKNCMSLCNVMQCISLFYRICALINHIIPNPLNDCMKRKGFYFSLSDTGIQLSFLQTITSLNRSNS